VASLSQGRTAAAQCGLFTHKSVPVIFEPPCISVNKCCISRYTAHFFSNSYFSLRLQMPINAVKFVCFSCSFCSTKTHIDIFRNKIN